MSIGGGSRGVSDCYRPIRTQEAIVVGAVGMGAPWFLTGWAEGTEVEFMIGAK